MIAYCEDRNAQPPGPMLVDMARARRVSSDELLGLKPVKDRTSPRTARILNRLRRIEELRRAEQRAVLRYLEALLRDRNGGGAGTSSPHRRQRVASG